MQEQSTVCCCGCGTALKPGKRFARGHNSKRLTDLSTRFWAKVERDGPIPAHCPHLGACWTWTGATSPDGRGAFSFQGRARRAHVVAYILTTGHKPPAETPCILHHCDGGDIGCVRPSHLYAGTNQDNSRDAVERGRMSHGERRSNAKLTDAQVRDIRRAYAAGGISYSQLGRQYGVSFSTTRNAAIQKTWRHV